MSDALHDMTTTPTMPPAPHVAADDERPPACPRCNRRLVILATHWASDESGAPVRRQMWGCPRGHATSYRIRGAFTPIQLLDEIS